MLKGNFDPGTCLNSHQCIERTMHRHGCSRSTLARRTLERGGTSEAGLRMGVHVEQELLLQGGRITWHCARLADGFHTAAIRL